MAELVTSPPPTNGYSNGTDDEDERAKMRPADIDAVRNHKTNSPSIKYYLLSINVIFVLCSGC